VVADPIHGSVLLKVTGSADSATSGDEYRLLFQSQTP
jgi:hypothetical protein